MAYSTNDYAADTLAVTLETLDEAAEKAELEREECAIQEAYEAVAQAREIVLKREAPTPTQSLVEALEKREREQSEIDGREHPQDKFI